LNTNFKHHMIMWPLFVVLFSVAVYCMELVEGNKITTTEHLGLQDFGIYSLWLLSMVATLLYPLTLLPLSWLTHKWVKIMPLRVFLYLLAGCALGPVLFRGLYEDSFIQEYQLNVSSAVLIFGVVGLIYSIADHYIARAAARMDDRVS